jgi:cell division protein ZapA
MEPSMRDATTTVSVKILDKEYQVSCAADEVDALTASARHVDQQMRQIRESGKVFGLDRIAVMTALNMANELLQRRKAVTEASSETEQMVKHLTYRITEALAEHRQPSA